MNAAAARWWCGGRMSDGGLSLTRRRGVGASVTGGTGLRASFARGIVGSGGASPHFFRGGGGSGAGALFPRREVCVVALAAEIFRDARSSSAPPPPADSRARAQPRPTI
jgi:hypothetical protein